MNRKGQALVEFILIVPVFLFILFTIVDFGTILNNKNNISNISNDIVEMYKNGDSIATIKNNYKDIDIKATKYKEKYIKINIEKNIKLITPGLNRVIGNPYKLKIERIVYES